MRGSPISFSFCNKEKRRRLHAGQCLSVHEYLNPHGLLYSRYFENGPLEPGYFQRACSQATFRVIPNRHSLSPFLVQAELVLVLAL